MKKNLPGIIITLVFFIIQLLTLSAYGIDPDSPFHLLRGQAYLLTLTTGRQKFTDINLASPVLFAPDQRISTYTQNAWEGVSDLIRPIAVFPGGKSIQAVFANYAEKSGRQSFYKSNIWNTDGYNIGAGHPPVSDILSAVTNRIFYEKLGLLGDVEAYHLYAVIAAALAVFMVYLFTKNAFGEVQAAITAISLALYPVFFAESHFNVKDIPEMAFFTISLTAFYFWVTKLKKKWFIIFTLSFFIALGTKPNIIFLPLILAVWLLATVRTPYFKKWFSGKIFIFAAIFAAVNLILLYLLWPYLWNETYLKIIRTVFFYKEVGAKDFSVQSAPVFGLPFGGNGLGTILTVTTTPLVMLLFAFTGLLTMIKSLRLKPVGILVLSWFIIPVLRVTFFSTDIFGSTRQFMEFIPALAIMAGVGGNFLLEKLSKLKPAYSRFIISSGIIAYAVILAFINIYYFPNQNVFFNSLTGGVKGARDKHILDWQTSNGNPYRQAVTWLNQNAPKDIKLAHLDGSMISISPLWLRHDILLGSYFSGLAQKGEYVISVAYPSPPKVFPYLYLEKFLEPLHEIKVDGVTIMKIWQNDPKFVRPEFRKTRIISLNSPPDFGSDATGSYWQADLGKKYQLVSITMEIPLENCSKNSGLFFLRDYFIPYRSDKNETVSEFYFPATSTSLIRFYPINANSCFKDGKIKSITVL